MNNMSEKPTKQGWILVYDQSGITPRYVMPDRSIDTHDPQRGKTRYLSWDEYWKLHAYENEDVIPIGWDYLNPDPVEMKWEKTGNPYLTGKAGSVTIKIFGDGELHPDDTGVLMRFGCLWNVEIEGHLVGNGRCGSPEDAQAAATKWSNDNLSIIPKVRLKP